MLCRAPYETTYAESYGYRRGGIHAYQGNADILIRATSETIFCAPIQIFHYVRDHRYLPRREFIDAVMTADDEDMSWYARK